MQDHLRSIFDKIGLRRRRDLVADLWHYLPQMGSPSLSTDGRHVPADGGRSPDVSWAGSRRSEHARASSIRDWWSARGSAVGGLSRIDEERADEGGGQAERPDRLTSPIVIRSLVLPKTTLRPRLTAPLGVKLAGTE